MYRHELLHNRILEALEQTPDGLSQLALMCECHGYRHAHQKLLYFSVRERSLKQEGLFEEVNELLQTVLDEADDEHNVRAEKVKVEEARRHKRAEKLRAYEFAEPPAEVVVRPASRRLVSGNPLYDELDSGRAAKSQAELGLMRTTVAALHAFDTAAATGLTSHLDLGVTGGIFSAEPTLSGLLAENEALLGARGSLYGGELLSGVVAQAGLKPPVYETIPEERGPSEYGLLNDELEQKLGQYPKVVWQKLKTERHFVEDETVQRQVQAARQATRRALLALVESGQVAVEGERSEALYRLVDGAA